MNSQMKIHRVRSGRIPGAGTSVGLPVELGSSPSLHMDVVTNLDAPLVFFFFFPKESCLSTYAASYFQGLWFSIENVENMFAEK